VGGQLGRPGIPPHREENRHGGRLCVATFSDSSVLTGTTYCYRIQAFNVAGESGYSNEACGAVSNGFDLSVTRNGTGTGVVASNPGGVSCGTDCSENYRVGTVVTLAATAATHSVFVGWSGAGCGGTGPCTLTGNAPVTVTATFATRSSTGASVQSFTLINADTDRPIAGFDPLPDGATLNLNTLPTRRLNIRANTSPATVGSVRFGLDGKSSFRIESDTPYMLAGNTGSDIYAWTPSRGTHTVTATPYSDRNGAGTRGTPMTIRFRVE
jgi:Divergent InlB B-repeat domain